MVSNLKLCGRSSVVDGSRCLHLFMKLVLVRHIQGWRLPPAWACQSTLVQILLKCEVFLHSHFSLLAVACFDKDLPRQGESIAPCLLVVCALAWKHRAVCKQAAVAASASLTVLLQTMTPTIKARSDRVSKTVPLCCPRSATAKSLYKNPIPRE